jgi:hypothetical protein
MSRTIPLIQSASVTLNSEGTGTAQIGPSNPGEVWQPSVVSVSTDETTITNEAQCKVYCGSSAIQSCYVDGTLSGSTGDSTGNVSGQILYPGQYVIAVWTGGDSGVLATMNVQGQRQVP